MREADGDVVRIEVRCSPGTYIRAIARDLGAALGCGGHLTALRRTRSGSFGLERAVPGDALEWAARECLQPLRECLGEWPAVTVTEEGRRALRHGRDLSPELVATGFPEGHPAEWYRVLDAEGELVALAVARGFGAESTQAPVLHPDVVLLTP